MTDLLQTDLQTTPQEDTLDPALTKKLVNKKQIRLLFPYAQRGEAKKLGAKWNSVEKFWYYPSVDGKLPADLIKYKCNDIYIEYEDKEYWREILPSMKWDSNKRNWIVNERDYQIFLNL